MATTSKATKANKGVVLKKPPPRKQERVNPAKQILDLEYKRKMRAQAERESSMASSRHSSLAPSSRAGSVDSASEAGSPPPPGPVKKCKASHCQGTKVNADGLCESCGTVVIQDANIVAEQEFTEGPKGAIQASGHKVGYGEAGPRMNFANGKRQIAGNGGGRTNQATLEHAKHILEGIVQKVTRSCVPAVVQERASYTFQRVQTVGWVRGRTIDKVTAVCLYYAVRNSDFTGCMLIDIADAIGADVFILGRWFKGLLYVLHGVDDGNGGSVIKNCPFEPLYPEDAIRIICTRLGFDIKTEKVQRDAVRILQRLDRDWIVSGRKPAGNCGTAIIVAARMNNFRRTVTEVAYASKVGEGTIMKRLEEFGRVNTAAQTVTDFKVKPFIKEAHDPPAFYRHSKEYLEGEEKKKAEKAARKRKRPAANEDANTEDAEASNGNKKRRTEPRIDKDGFAIPARPSKSQVAAAAAQPEIEALLDEHVTEACILSEPDALMATAAKYGDISVPGAKEIRKNRFQGSSMREPECDPEDKLTAEEEAQMKEMEDEMNDPESEVYKAAADYAQTTTNMLLAALHSTRPLAYKLDETVIDGDLLDEEFDDDPEVMHCCLSAQESEIKEMLWLNENKSWMRKQIEKKHQDPKKPRRSHNKNSKRPGIGYGQTSPANSAGEAALLAAKRLKVSKKIDYMKIQNMFNTGPGGRGGPGSDAGTLTSAQTSRLGSPVESEDQDKGPEYSDEDVEDEEQVVE